jgi:amidohydrolase
MTDIWGRAQAQQDEMVRLRRAIHQHPELGFEEYKTAALVAETLQSLGIRTRTGVGRTGVVGYLGAGKPTIGIRADMDALPIQEDNDVPYASQVPGLMHACGHDAHTAGLLGTAMVLAQLQAEGALPAGEVRFLFQPCEEKADAEGKSGAYRMVDDGALDGVDAVIALHVDSQVPFRTIRLASGPTAASVTNFQTVLKGKSCNSAYPYRGIDAIYLAQQVLSVIYAGYSRNVDPFKPAMISVGSIHGGTAPNVLVDHLEMSGTIRAYDEQSRQKLVKLLQNGLENARNLGGDYELEITKAISAMVNHPDMVELIREVGAEYLGEENVNPQIVGLGGEDFGHMIEVCGGQGAMFILGSAIEGKARPTHIPDFDIDERCLPIGAAVLAETAVRYLSEKEGSASG